MTPARIFRTALVESLPISLVDLAASASTSLPDSATSQLIATWGGGGIIILAQFFVIKYLFAELMKSQGRMIDLAEKNGNALSRTADALEEANRQSASQATRWEVLLSLMKSGGFAK